MPRPLVVLLLGLLPASLFGAAPGRLFERIDAEPLRIELSGPLKAIARDEDPDPERRSGELVLLDGGERFTVSLKPRGKSRRKRSNCRFPPLWIRMRKADVKNTVFAGHHRRKLVTQCEALTRPGRDTSKVWIEMLAYRTLNLLTERSLRVQPLLINYRDTADPERTYDHPGFLLEHKQELARRLELKAVDEPQLRLAELEPVHANLVALFNLLIGNPDYSLTQGPPGDDCCHNSVPMRDAAGTAYPIIYDFDNTGLVDPRYASPPEVLRIRTVRTRVYRGYCQHNPQLAETLERLAAKRTAIEALFSEHPEIVKAEKKRVARYLRQFFERYQPGRNAESRLVKACLG